MVRMNRSGDVEVERPAPGVVRTRVSGHARLEHLTPIIRAVESEMEAGRRPHVFHDWSEMTGYDSAARVGMAEWYAKVKDGVASVQVLTKNRLVAMGVQVVALAVRADIQIFGNRSAFDAAFRKACRARDSG